MITATGMDPYFLATQQMPYDAYSQYYAQLLAGAQQNQGTQQSQGAQLGTSNLTFQGTQPQVKRAAQEEKSGAGTALTLGAIATLGAVAFFGHRSGKQVLQKLGKEENLFQTTWAGIKSWFPKFGQQADNLIKSSQEYTLVKDGVKITVKDGKVTKIIERNGVETITDKNKMQKFLKENNLSDEVSKLRFEQSKKLPDNVHIRYEKTIGGRKYVVENGEIVEIWMKGTNKKLPKSKWESFFRNNPTDVAQATTLSKTLTGKQVDGISDTIKVSITKDGAHRYTVGGKEATDEEIKLIKKAYKNDINNIGKTVGESLDDVTITNYIYEVNGNRVLFDIPSGSKKAKYTSIEKLTENTIEGDNITKYLDDNELKDQLNTIMNDGKLSDGWGFGELFVKTDSGVCKISENGKKLETLKLNKEFKHGDKVYNADEEISGKVLEAWQKENKDEYDKILGLLK